jgi:uncharacterized membrane protein
MKIIRSAMIVFIAAVLALSAGAVAAKPGAPGGKDKAVKARITWSVARVEQTLVAGQTATVDVTLTSSADVSNATLRIPGGLGRVVSVSPATFSLKAGVAQAVRLTIAMPAEGAHSQGGVIQVRSGKRNLPQSLKVNVTVPGDEDEDEES